jgi:hypothetical protein
VHSSLLYATQNKVINYLMIGDYIECEHPPIHLHPVIEGVKLGLVFVFMQFVNVFGGERERLRMTIERMLL